MIEKIIQKSLNDTELSDKEIKDLFKVPVFSKETVHLLWAARKKSTRVSNGTAEVHAQIGLNVAPVHKIVNFVPLQVGTRYLPVLLNFPLMTRFSRLDNLRRIKRTQFT